MNPLRLDDLVAAVSARLRVARTPCVFAVWQDGSVSEEAEGFVNRLHTNGQIQAPLATFASNATIAKSSIRLRIQSGMRSRGLHPD